MVKLPGSICTSFRASLELGEHLTLNLAKYSPSRDGSASEISPLPEKLYSRLVNVKQCAFPIVCAPKYSHPKINVKGEKRERRRVPERSTRSFALRPRMPNWVFKLEMLAEKAGRVRVSMAFETRPSLRPVGTSQNGPLSWHNRFLRTKLFIFLL